MKNREKLTKKARVLSVYFCAGITLLTAQHLMTGLSIYLNYAFGLILVYLTLQTIILASIVKNKD